MVCVINGTRESRHPKKRPARVRLPLLMTLTKINNNQIEKKIRGDKNAFQSDI